MQTIQLLDGKEGRGRFLARARAHLTEGGRLAIAIADELEPFEATSATLGPLPDVREIDGIVYSSQPTAVRVNGDRFVLERRRETVTVDGRLDVEQDVIDLDRVDAEALTAEGLAQGLTPLQPLEVPPTDEYVGSTVVVFGA
jgi:hypothetical protein